MDNEIYKDDCGWRPNSPTKLNSSIDGIEQQKEREIHGDEISALQQAIISFLDFQPDIYDQEACIQCSNAIIEIISNIDRKGKQNNYSQYCPFISHLDIANFIHLRV